MGKECLLIINEKFSKNKLSVVIIKKSMRNVKRLHKDFLIFFRVFTRRYKRLNQQDYFC